MHRQKQTLTDASSWVLKREPNELSSRNAELQNIISTSIQSAFHDLEARPQGGSSASRCEPALAIVPFQRYPPDGVEAVMARVIEHVTKSHIGAKAVARMARQAAEGFEAEAHNLQISLEALQELVAQLSASRGAQ